MENKTVTLKKYKPNIFIKIGATLNIIFASLFSVIGFTSFITIPAIVFNAFLFQTKVSEKKYWGTVRIIPIILSFIIGLLMILIIFFSSEFLFRMYNAIVDSINVAMFWTNNKLSHQDKDFNIFLWLKILFVVVSLLGNSFILIGWYKGKIMMISESESTNKKDVKAKIKKEKIKRNTEKIKNKTIKTQEKTEKIKNKEK